MGIMGAGFIKGASDAFTERMYDVITKKTDLKTKIGQETTTGDIIEQSLLQLGKKEADDVIDIATEFVKSNQLGGTAPLPEEYAFMKDYAKDQDSIRAVLIGIMLEADKDERIDISNPLDWDRVLSTNRIGLYEPRLMKSEVLDPKTKEPRIDPGTGKPMTAIDYFDARATFDTSKAWQDADPQGWIKRTLGEPTQTGMLEEEARRRGITVEDVERKRAFGALGGDPKSLIETGMLVRPTLSESLAALIDIPMASLKYMSATIPAFEKEAIEQTVHYIISLDEPNLLNLFYKNDGIHEGKRDLTPMARTDNITDAGKTAIGQLAVYAMNPDYTDNLAATEQMDLLLYKLGLPLIGTDKSKESGLDIGTLVALDILNGKSTLEDAKKLLAGYTTDPAVLNSDATALLSAVKAFIEGNK